MPTRILIADDHAIVREGLRKLLQAQEDFSVVGEAADGIEAVERTRQLEPDILLLDLSMPLLDGLGVLKALSAEKCGTRCVLLTASIEPEETVDALRLGAHGVVLKASITDVLYQCIRAVAAGAFWVGQERLGDLVRSLRKVDPAEAREAPPAARLTPREYQVIAAILGGATTRDMGGQFSISQQTVKNHLSRIFDKLGVSSRLELALYAVHHRLLDRFDPAKVAVRDQ
jgi:two-component system, NarL family, nitrate/nitrite response regulator NarL